MLKIIKDCFTEKNNETYDIVRILGVISYSIYNMVTIAHNLHSCGAFDSNSYASGMSILLGTISAGVAIKYKTED